MTLNAHRRSRRSFPSFFHSANRSERSRKFKCSRFRLEHPIDCNLLLCPRIYSSKIDVSITESDVFSMTDWLTLQFGFGSMQRPMLPNDNNIAIVSHFVSAFSHRSPKCLIENCATNQNRIADLRRWLTVLMFIGRHIVSTRKWNENYIVAICDSKGDENTVTVGIYLKLIDIYWQPAVCQRCSLLDLRFAPSNLSRSSHFLLLAPYSSEFPSKGICVHCVRAWEIRCYTARFAMHLLFLFVVFVPVSRFGVHAV